MHPARGRAPVVLSVLALVITCTAVGYSASAQPPPPPPPRQQHAPVKEPLVAADGIKVGSRVVFAGDYDNGSLTQWWTLQARDHNEHPGTYCTYSACVRDGGPEHPTAGRFEVRDGDVPSFGGGERAEVRTGDGLTSGAYVREGDERWYDFAIKFDETFVNPRRGSDGWFIVMQWFPGDNGLLPPLALQVSRAGMLELGGAGAATDFRRSIGPVEPGVWNRYVVHVKFSVDPAVGFAEVWRDGVLAVPRYSRPTMASDVSYLKQGVYRDAGASGTQVVWHDGLRITAP